MKTVAEVMIEQEVIDEVKAFIKSKTKYGYGCVDEFIKDSIRHLLLQGVCNQ